MNRAVRSISFTSLVAVALFATPALLFAQGGGFRGGPGGGFGGGGVLGLLYRDDVRQDLQLVDEQQEKVDALAEEIRTELQDEMREMFRGMQDLSDEERQQQFEKIRSRMQEVNADAEKRLKKVLLPHQFDRLKQIDVQMRVQQQGAGALTTGELAETLDLTDSQRERLEERAAEVEQELQEKISKLRIEARNKMLDVLTAEQRAKLESLMGDDFAATDPAPGFGRRGGRGGFFGGGNRNGNGGVERRGRNRGSDRDTN
jgi:Spy/CpxP family protein refolding chaperone